MDVVDNNLEEFWNENQFRNVRKKKRTRTIIIAIIAVIAAIALGVTLLFRNLLTERDPISLETFFYVMEENGYQIHDLNYRLVDDVMGDVIDRYFAATDWSTEFEFLEMIDENEAQNFFINIRTAWENDRGSTHTQSHVNGINFNTFRLTTGGRYREMLRIDHVLIIGDGEQSSRNEIQALFESLEDNN